MFEDTAGPSNAGEISCDSLNQVNRFFETNQSWLYFQDIPENENILESELQTCNSQTSLSEIVNKSDLTPDETGKSFSVKDSSFGPHKTYCNPKHYSGASKSCNGQISVSELVNENDSTPDEPESSFSFTNSSVGSHKIYCSQRQYSKATKPSVTHENNISLSSKVLNFKDLSAKQVAPNRIIDQHKNSLENAEMLKEDSNTISRKKKLRLTPRNSSGRCKQLRKQEIAISATNSTFSKGEDHSVKKCTSSFNDDTFTKKVSVKPVLNIKHETSISNLFLKYSLEINENPVVIDALKNADQHLPRVFLTDIFYNVVFKDYFNATSNYFSHKSSRYTCAKKYHNRSKKSDLQEGNFMHSIDKSSKGNKRRENATKKIDESFDKTDELTEDLEKLYDLQDNSINVASNNSFPNVKQQKNYSKLPYGNKTKRQSKKILEDTFKSPNSQVLEDRDTKILSSSDKGKKKTEKSPRKFSKLGSSSLVNDSTDSVSITISNLSQSKKTLSFMDMLKKYSEESSVEPKSTSHEMLGKKVTEFEKETSKALEIPSSASLSAGVKTNSFATSFNKSQPFGESVNKGKSPVNIHHSKNVEETSTNLSSRRKARAQITSLNSEFQNATSSKKSSKKNTTEKSLIKFDPLTENKANSSQKKKKQLKFISDLLSTENKVNGPVVNKNSEKQRFSADSYKGLSNNKRKRSDSTETELYFQSLEKTSANISPQKKGHLKLVHNMLNFEKDDSVSKNKKQKLLASDFSKESPTGKKLESNSTEPKISNLNPMETISTKVPPKRGRRATLASLSLNIEDDGTESETNKNLLIQEKRRFSADSSKKSPIKKNMKSDTTEPKLLSLNSKKKTRNSAKKKQHSKLAFNLLNMEDFIDESKIINKSLKKRQRSFSTDSSKESPSKKNKRFASPETKQPDFNSVATTSNDSPKAKKKALTKVRRSKRNLASTSKSFKNLLNNVSSQADSNIEIDHNFISENEHEIETNETHSDLPCDKGKVVENALTSNSFSPTYYNKSNESQILAVPGLQNAKIILSPMTNSLSFGSPFVQMPSQINPNMYQFALQPQNPIFFQNQGTSSSPHPGFSVSQPLYTLPAFQNPIVLPSNFQYNNSLNAIGLNQNFTPISNAISNTSAVKNLPNMTPIFNAASNSSPKVNFSNETVSNMSLKSNLGNEASASYASAKTNSANDISLSNTPSKINLPSDGFKCNPPSDSLSNINFPGPSKSHFRIFQQKTKTNVTHTITDTKKKRDKSKNHVHAKNKGIALIKDIVEKDRTMCNFEICDEVLRYYTENEYASRITVKEYFESSELPEWLQDKIIDTVPDFDIPPKVEYVFDDLFHEAPIREVLKDYVTFHVDALFDGFKGQSASKDHFVRKAYKYFPFRDCAYLCEFLPKDNEELNIKDVSLFLSCSAMLVMLDELKKRNILA